MSAAAVGPTDPPLPPIHKISDDILYEIFFLNTCKEVEFWDPFGHSDWRKTKLRSPLLNIRRASQVCRAWRDILLCSPSIWARCMEIDAFGQKHDNWRNLMLNRIGQSPLSIMVRGRNHSANPSFRFLEDLLDKHWTRVSELFLTIDCMNTTHTRIAEPFRRPAENLRVFALRSTGGWLPLNFQLFRGHAPRLECLWLLRVHNAGIHFKAPTMFTSNMCSLELDEVSNLNIRDLLAACSRMPLLEKLKLYISNLNTGDVPEDTSLSCIVMPRLKFLDLCCATFNIYPFFLDRLTPSAGCQLHLTHAQHAFGSRPRISDFSSILLQSMHSVLCKYGHSIFIEHQGQPNFANIGLHLSQSEYTFFCYGDRFRITLPSYLIIALSQLFVTISTLDHAISGQLDLKIGISRQQISYWVRFDVIPKFVQAINSLGAIDTLQINDAHFQKHPGPRFFPSLKKLILGKNPNVDMIAVALPFLKQRYTIAPVEVLEINLDDKATVPWKEIHSLDELVGLKVVWTRKGRPFQYICGSNELRRGLK